ncbi:hypothetical protein TNCV_1800871 [Trichonephila clavipes]|nr:hypothetical protein TNCV_1800871 [Trichonephila clavipes]
MADLLPRNRVLPNTTSQRGDTSQVLPYRRKEGRRRDVTLLVSVSCERTDSDR